MCAGEQQSSQSQRQQKSSAAGVGVGGAAVAGGTQLPLARVKLIIKTDPDTSLASQEAVLLVTKVTSYPDYTWGNCLCVFVLQVNPP